MLTLRQHKGGDFSKLKVLDRRRHPPLARGPFRPAGAAHAGRRRNPRLRARPRCCPRRTCCAAARSCLDLDEALAGVDAVMMLRLQRERMEEGLVPSLDGYFADYGLTRAAWRCAARDAVVHASRAR